MINQTNYKKIIYPIAVLSLGFVGYILLRLPIVLSLPPDVDEVTSMLTFSFITKHNTWIPYYVGQGYLGTLIESILWLISSIDSIGNISSITLRLTNIFISYVGILFIFFSLKDKLKSYKLYLLLLFLLIPPTSFYFISSKSIPGYSTGLLAISILIFTALKISDRSNYQENNKIHLKYWFLLGIIGGICTYLHPITRLQFLVCIFYLISFSINIIETIITRNFWTRQVLKFIFFASLSIVFIAPSIYRYLTRRNSYEPKSIEIFLISLSLIFVTIALVVLWKTIKDKKKYYPYVKGVIISSVIALIIPFFVNSYFDFKFSPIYQQLEVDLWSASSYSLKHIHDWFSQLILYFDEILYRSIFYTNEPMEGGMLSYDSITSRSILFLFLFLIIIYGYAIYLIQGVRNNSKNILVHFLITLPVIFLTILLIPSYRLSNEYSYRYYFPYLAGFGLILIDSIDHLIKSFQINIHKKVTVLFFLFYLSYCLFSNLSVAKSAFTNPQYNQIILFSTWVNENDVDVYVGSNHSNVIWHSAGEVIGFSDTPKQSKSNFRMMQYVSLENSNNNIHVMTSSSISEKQLREVLDISINNKINFVNLKQFNESKYKVWKIDQ